ncbi:protein JTB-like [Glandiceps talaboti]
MGSWQVGLSLLLTVLYSCVVCAENSLPKPENLENVLCWQTEDFTVVENSCKPCQGIEFSVLKTACSSTGFKEKVKCLQSGSEVYKSCPRPSWLEERIFWAFEGFMFVVGFCSCGMVVLRRKKIEKNMMERVQRQISAAV